MLLIQKQTQDQELLNGLVEHYKKLQNGILNAHQFVVIIVKLGCQHIHSGVFRYMDAINVSWECLNCGMPNFSTALFNSTYSIESDNHLSHLSKNSILSSPGVPAAASSPKLPESSRHDRKLTKDISNKVKRPIRVLNINFQSVCNK